MRPEERQKENQEIISMEEYLNKRQKLKEKQKEKEGKYEKKPCLDVDRALCLIL